MLVQIYETQTPEEGVSLARFGVDHVGVLVGPGSFSRELSIERARAIFAALPNETKKLALSLSAQPDEIGSVITKQPLISFTLVPP